MLIEFSVENFRSIKEKVTLSMVASADKSKGDNLTIHEGPLKHELLNSAAIYGANASGKSNVLRALAELQSMVLTSHNLQKGMSLNHTPFAFDCESCNSPTRYSIVFLADRVMHEYCLAHDADEIMEESLHHYPKGRRALIFSREGQDYRFSRDRSEQTPLAKRTLENVPYLSSSVQQNYSAVLPAFQWFQDNLSSSFPSSFDRQLDMAIGKMEKSEDHKKAVLKFFGNADINIRDIIIKSHDVQTWESGFGHHRNPYAGFEGTSGQTIYDVSLMQAWYDESGKEYSAPLKLNEESEGTRKLLLYANLILDALKEGKTLMLDEFDTKMHPHLCEWLVELFHSPEQNPRGAQLLFNTHDVLLLNQENFRRDQIWFTERNAGNGSTSLYSLLEFRERKDRDIMKAYLLGRYGAIPFHQQLSD